jgi:hypothetical protein
MHILFTLLLLMTGLPLTSQTTETSLRIFQAQVVDQRILYPKDYVQLRSPENLIAADAHSKELDGSYLRTGLRLLSCHCPDVSNRKPFRSAASGNRKTALCAWICPESADSA